MKKQIIEYISKYFLPIFMFCSLSISNLQAFDGPYAPPCDPCCQDTCCFTVNAELLFWAYLWQQIYATDRAAVAPAVGGGKGIDIPTELDPGFRVGIEFPLVNCCGDGWNVYAQYTWFYSGLDDTASSSDLRSAVSSLGADVRQFNEGSAKIGLHLNVVEAGARRDIYLARCFLFRPFLGLTGASILKKQNFEFINPAAPFFNTVQERFKFCGVGPLIGAEYEWRFASCWSLFGRSLAGTYIGSFRHEKKEVDSLDGLFDFRENFVAAGAYFLQTFGILTNLCWNGFNFNLGADWDVAGFFVQNFRVIMTGLTIKTGYCF